MSRKLPTVPTQFCGVSVPLWDDLALWIDGNSKVTASGGTYENPAPNAFSLPQIATCPGSTKACREACYVHGLEEASRWTWEHYRENERVIHAILKAGGHFAAKTLARWISTNCTEFRWHVSGDVFSWAYADWIDEVCQRSPDTLFWIYTRSFDFVAAFGAENLIVNLSADRDNHPEAVKCQARYPGTRICYMCSGEPLPELPPGSVIFPDYMLRGRKLAEPTDAPWWQSLTQDQREMVCPADFFGQSESYRCGVCTKCMVAP